MRIAVGFASLVVVAAMSAQEPPRFAREAHTLAAGCVASTLACGGTDSGELAPGDCTFSDGTRYDTWRFAGTIGQQITVSMQPLDASYTKPQLYLVPPIGDASKTPAVLGASPLAISYSLASTGTWTVAVATGDLFASGKYKISLECESAQAGVPQNCVYQELSCDQSYDWFVTASSCQFEGGGWAYAPFSMQMVQGDSVRFSAHSDAYDPAVAVYRNGGQALAYNYGKRFTTDAVVYFTAPVTDTYDVTVYGATAQSAGEFYMAASCIAVCTAPSITTQPVSQSVVYGGSTTLTVAASSPNGNAPSYEWRDGVGFPSTIGSGASLILSNVTAKRTVFAHVTNACGSTDSIVATVTPAACVPPTITGQPASGTVGFGKPWTVGVGVTLDATQPVRYVWLQGQPPDASHPVPNGNGPQLQITATAPGSYWANVSNQCGSGNSLPATLTVTGIPRSRAARH